MRCGLDIRRSRDIVCSISQNIQTNAVPKPTTTIKNINVNWGAVVMFNIPDPTRATHGDEIDNGPGYGNTETCCFIPP